MPRGGFGGGGFGRGGFGRGGFGRGYGMRRFGSPLIMGGYGMGGFGSPLLTSLLAGGVGYALGSSNSAQQGQQYPYPPQYPYPYPYQAPPPAAPQAQPASADSGKLSQLQLLERLHDSGTLTDQEFEQEKQRILNS